MARTRCHLWAPLGLLALCLLPAMAANAAGEPVHANPRGWKVDVSCKEAAGHHSRRMALAHEEHGPALMSAWWVDWKAFHAREYKDQAEEARAYSAFQANMRLVHDINSRPDLTFWASGNQFSDLTWDEFKSRYLGTPAPVDTVTAGNNTSAASPATARAASTNSTSLQASRAGARRLLQQVFDWRQQGISTPVRNQGSCGGCWAFAGVHALEAAYMIANDISTPVQFSVQQALDCLGLGGCGFGSAAEFMNALTRTSLAIDAVYPLTSSKTGVAGACRNNAASQAQGNRQVVTYSASTAGYDRFAGVDEPTLMQATRVNPLVHHFEVDVAFMTYAGGVYTGQTCTGNLLNHALTNYGYNLNEGSWLFKNSWGPTWGEKGYVRIRMVGGTGTCGLYKWAFRPSQQFGSMLSSAAVAMSASSAASSKGTR